MIQSARPHMSAFTIFRRDDGKIAFLLRENTGWMNGRYGLPAGKVEEGESATAAAIREAKEEVGVDIDLADLEHALTVYRTSSTDDGTFWVDILFEVKKWEGDLYNAEPHRHSELAWFSPDTLPDNTTPYILFFMSQIKAGNRYAEYGWDSYSRH